MNRKTYIEMVRRQIYGGQPADDATITVGLVNKWLDIAIAAAAKQNNKDNITIDGISYINNSFYTIFKGLSVTKDENFLWKIELPQLPLGIGTSEGISTLEFKDPTTGEIAYPAVMMSENQRSFQRGVRMIPNKILAYSQGEFIYALSTLILSPYTASVTMVSGGNSNDLSSTINVPNDYFTLIVEYLKQQFAYSLNVKVDGANDGRDVNLDA